MNENQRKSGQVHEKRTCPSTYRNTLFPLTLSQRIPFLELNGQVCALSSMFLLCVSTQQWVNKLVWQSSWRERAFTEEPSRPCGETPGYSARAPTDSRSAQWSGHLLGVELGHQVCAETLGDKSLVLQALQWAGRRKPHRFEGRRDPQLGGCWGGEEEQRGEEPSFKVTFMGTKSQEVEGALVRPAGPEGHRWWDSATAPEDRPSHLRRPLIHLSLCAGTANNQLKLADFPTFVREPAALAQLSICRKGSREPEKKKAFKSLFLFISLFSAPPPRSLHCHAFLLLLSFFKKSFYNHLFLYVARALGILPVTCL